MHIRAKLLMSLLLLAGCGLGGRDGRPQPGDEVRPALANSIRWEAGQRGALWVELRATSPQGKTRRLGFEASPEKNPFASIEFYGPDDQPLQRCEVELTERCWGGKYHTDLVQVPQNAYKADINVRIDIVATDFTVMPLEQKGIAIER